VPAFALPLHALIGTDDELTDRWEAGIEFPGGTSHRDHVRIAWVLDRRHGPDEARRRLLSGTKRACEVHLSPENFDAALTERWARAIAGAAERDGLGRTADHFITTHPELLQGDQFGAPRITTPSARRSDEAPRRRKR
jgi:hypothetical protein